MLNNQYSVLTTLLTNNCTLNTYFFMGLQEGFFEGDQDHVAAARREHRACAGRVYGGGTALHDRGVHEVRRPASVPQ